MKEIFKILNLAKEKLGYPSIKVLQSATGPKVLIDNKKISMFGLEFYFYFK